jgi:glutaredoxin
MNRRIHKSKYLTVFALTCLIFIIGILVGSYFSNLKLAQVDSIGQELKTDTVSMELQYELIAENPCEYINSTLLADELWEMASKLDFMENKLGEKNLEVIELKEYYSLLEIRHWLFMKKTNKECEKDTLLILYFYTNEQDCPTCKEQGFILTWLRKNYDDVYIYAFDSSIDNVALNTLKRTHGITGTPAIVIDNDAYNKFLTKEDLEKLVKEKGFNKN